METQTRKNFLQKAGLAVLLACLLLCTLVLLDANKIQTSAASNNLLVTEQSFVNVRSKVNGSCDLETFVTKGFQTNESNFVPISATAIGNLKDPDRGNVSLKSMADDVRRNKRGDGIVTGPKITGYGAVSVLTYGQGGLALARSGQTRILHCAPYSAGL